MKSASAQLLLISNDPDTDETISVDLIPSSHFSDFGLVKICGSDGISKNYLYFSENTRKKTVNELPHRKRVGDQPQKSDTNRTTNGRVTNPVEINSKKIDS